MTDLTNVPKNKKLTIAKNIKHYSTRRRVATVMCILIFTGAAALNALGAPVGSVIEMTACIVSGNTFPYRDTLKQWGGRWNQSARNWTFDDLEPHRVDRLRRFVGVVVNEIEDDIDTVLAWLAERNDHRDYAPIVRGDCTQYRNYFATQPTIAHFGFSSLGALVDHVSALPRPDNRNGTCDIGWTENANQTKYTGTPSLAEAIRLAREGWSDGLGLTGMLDTPPARHKQRLRSVAGGTVSVGRMLAGNPAHMVKRKRLPGHRIITLFVETVMWQGITTWNAMLRVWLICAMIDRLESEGYRCEVISVYCALHRKTWRGYQTTVRLKSAGDRLSLADMSFALGHPSFGRRIIYAIEGAEPACGLTHEFRGIIDQAFDDDHQPGRNEFYIPQLSGVEQAALDDTDPFDMLRFIQPDGLPVKLLER